jgi:hypothetical protein
MRVDELAELVGVAALLVVRVISVSQMTEHTLDGLTVSVWRDLEGLVVVR